MASDPIIFQINNKVNWIIAQLQKEAGATSVPTVDYVVDMFDRLDADSLGEYWESDTGFALRDGVCVSYGDNVIGGGTVFFDSISYSFALDDGVLDGVAKIDDITPAIAIRRIDLLAGTPWPVPSQYIKNRYDREISSGNFICLLRFKAKSPDSISDRWNVCSLPVALGYSNRNQKYIGFGMSSLEIPTLNIPDVTLSASWTGVAGSYTNGRYASPTSAAMQSSMTVPGLSIPGKKLADMRFGDFSTVSTILRTISTDANSDQFPSDTYTGNTDSYFWQLFKSDGDLDDSGTGTFAVKAFRGGLSATQLAYYQAADYPLLLSGDNSVKIEADGNTYTVYLNDTLIYSGENTIIAANDRNRPFMGMSANNIVAIINSYGIDAFGITCFKAWRSDIPEPPDQSGHGKYEADSAAPYRYNDKYHTPIRNAQRAIVGYEYNPLA